MKEKKSFYKRAPESPGVYSMKDIRGHVLYIGKAGNLKRRVSSYFLRPHDARIEKLVREIATITYKKTDTTLEALILEADLIKKHKPLYNIKEKDDKSFLCVEITKDEFPRVLLVRGKTKPGGMRYGPFTSASSVREALRIIRRIFPFGIHAPERIGSFKRSCFDYEVGLCPGTCSGEVSRKEYLKNIKNIQLLFEGKKATILKNLEREMRSASIKTEFENALKLRKQIFALRHIQDVALISDSKNETSGIGDTVALRIKGYDISNISGTSAVGVMVVFIDGKPSKNDYRKFKIQTIQKSDDVGMLREVFERRFAHREWLLPDLVLVDGGKAQVNAAIRVLEDVGYKIPILGIAKGPQRKKNEFIGQIPKHTNESILIKVRDEAHRFAIAYHKKIRSERSMS